MTREAFMKSKIGVLQLLSPDQVSLVPVLGKRSGYETDFSKADACNLLGFKWFNAGAEIFGDDSSSRCGNNDLLYLLPGCAQYIFIKFVDFTPAGDHDACLVQVINTATWDEETQNIIVCDVNNAQLPLDETSALYTGCLREKGII